MGTSYSTSNGGQYGGYGGGISGGSGGQYNSNIPEFTATGGTDSRGGKMGYNPNVDTLHGEDGQKVFGGSIPSQDVYSSGGGGVGGYFGGGSSIASGGGGGSGFVGGVMSYRNIIAQTIAGNDKFPSPYGGYENGHIGNGFIRITALNSPMNCYTPNVKYNKNIFFSLLFIIIYIKCY